MWGSNEAPHNQGEMIHFGEKNSVAAGGLGTADSRAGEESWGNVSCRGQCLSAQRSCADCRLMPTARPMSAQETPAAFAAATVLSNLWPA